MNESSELPDTALSAEVHKLTADDLIRSMTDVLKEKASARSLKTYLEEKCEGIRIGNTDVIFVEEDHAKDIELNPSLESLVRAPGTKAILVEYFEPELAANARKFPVLGKLVKAVFEHSISKRLEKTALSNKVAEIAKETQKPIAVADIANKAEYYYGYSFSTSGLFAVAQLFPPFIPVALVYGSMYGVNFIQEFITKKGHFDTEEIHRYEKVLLGIEDARRVFVAMGIRQLADEYKPENAEPCRILACYPKAHAMRIANYLTEEGLFSRISKGAKERLYRLYPALDISVRQYRFRDSLAQITGKSSLGGWKLYSDKSL